jgi:cutinase
MKMTLRHRRRRPDCVGVAHRLGSKYSRPTKGNSVHETTRYGISPLSWCAPLMTKVLEFAAVVMTMLAAAIAGPAIGTAAADGPCSDVEVIFARGTLEPPGPGTVGQEFSDALISRLGGRSVDVYGVNYPASLSFGQAADGVADAANKVLDTVHTCPGTKIVLGGYSQGAAIAAYITSDTVPPGYELPAGISGPLPPNVAPHVAAVTLFGKPSNGFLNLVDHDAPPITIGPLYAHKTLDLCTPQDPVCSSGEGFSRAAHSAYKTNGMTDQAADYAANAVRGR